MSWSVAAALAAAVCFGVASAGQFAAVARTPERDGLDPRLLADLARQGRWWLAGTAEVAAVGLQYAALHGASVALVQSLLVLGLPVAVLLGGSRSAPTLAAVAMTCVGLVVVAAGQSVPPGPTRTTVVAPVLLALAAGVTSRRAGPVLRGACAGVATGCASVLLAVVAAGPRQPVHLLEHAPIWAALGVGLVSVQLGQAALRAAAVGPPLAALTLAEPVTAIVLARVALHQHVGLSVPVGLGVAVATVGVGWLQAPSVLRLRRLHPWPRVQTTQVPVTPGTPPPAR